MEVWILLRGCCYAFNTHCETLKDAMREQNLKRSDISDWWKNPVGYDPLRGTAKDYFTYL